MCKFNEKGENHPHIITTTSFKIPKVWPLLLYLKQKNKLNGSEGRDGLKKEKNLKGKGNEC
jgi:hypothetical protein